MMAHEMMSSAPLYFRACLHYVYRCLRNQSMVMSYESLSNSNTMQKLINEKLVAHLRNPLEFMVASEQQNAVMDESTYEQSRLYYHYETEDSQKMREAEFLEDCHRTLFPTTSVRERMVLPSLSIVNVDGLVYVNSDFTTGIIHLNRTIFNKSMSMEDRRRVLFGSDQIIP